MTKKIQISDKEELRRLLQLFMEAATTLEQEAALAEYFRTNEVDDEFADYRDMFLVFESGELALSEAPIEASLPTAEPESPTPITAEPKPKSHIIPMLLRYTAVAASVAAAFFVGMRFATDEPASLVASVAPETTTIVKTDTVYLEKVIVQTIVEKVPTAPSPTLQPTDLAQATPTILHSITDEQVQNMYEDIEQEFERMTREMDLFEQELMN